MRALDDARQQADKINKEIRADDERFKNAVRIVHGDGSTFIFNYAFIVLIKVQYDQPTGGHDGIPKGSRKKTEEFIGVVAEHHLPMVFATEDLDQYDEYKMTTKQFRK